MTLLKNISKNVDTENLIHADKHEFELSINVRMFFDDFFGNRVLPTALPLASQTFLPLYLFGLTDFYGGYNKMNVILPLDINWLVGGNTFAVIENFNRPAGLAPYPNYLGVKFGDMILQYTDGINLCYIVIHCDNTAYGSLLNSLVSDLIYIHSLSYYIVTGTVNQFVNPLVFVYQNLFGLTFYDSLNLRTFLINTDFRNNIADIPVNFSLDKCLMLGTQLNYDTEEINIILKVSKVKKLFHL